MAPRRAAEESHVCHHADLRLLRERAWRALRIDGSSLHSDIPPHTDPWSSHLPPDAVERHPLPTTQKRWIALGTARQCVRNLTRQRTYLQSKRLAIRRWRRGRGQIQRHLFEPTNEQLFWKQPCYIAKWQVNNAGGWDKQKKQTEPALSQSFHKAHARHWIYGSEHHCSHA